MRSKMTPFPGILVVSLLMCAIPVLAQQQVTVSSPHTGVSDSFFEHTGTSWGAQGKNWFFSVRSAREPQWSSSAVRWIQSVGWSELRVRLQWWWSQWRIPGQFFAGIATVIYERHTIGHRSEWRNRDDHGYLGFTLRYGLRASCRWLPNRGSAACTVHDSASGRTFHRARYPVTRGCCRRCRTYPRVHRRGQKEWAPNRASPEETLSFLRGLHVQRRRRLTAPVDVRRRPIPVRRAGLAMGVAEANPASASRVDSTGHRSATIR